MSGSPSPSECGPPEGQAHQTDSPSQPSFSVCVCVCVCVCECVCVDMCLRCVYELVLLVYSIVTNIVCVGGGGRGKCWEREKNGWERHLSTEWRILNSCSIISRC